MCVPEIIKHVFYLAISFVKTDADVVVLFLVPETSHTAEVVLSSSAVLAAIFAFIAYVVYK